MELGLTFPLRRFLKIKATDHVTHELHPIRLVLRIITCRCIICCMLNRIRVCMILYTQLADGLQLLTRPQFAR